ncbi:MAG: OmpA family protein [Chitinispirillia bacterium]|nr:OmpA family protein [Chitinispirillia bacterium]MCL2267965.1 OmpA family protein [Chitinispirillia bacterium]
MRTKRQARVAVLVLLAAVVCVWAQKRITVPGSFPTIQAALNEAVEGDTVYVRNGTYYENITLVDDVVLLGQDKKSTIIDGRRRGPVITAADGAVISGFTIQNGRTGILCKNTRPIIMNNIIMDNKGTGIHALVSLPEIVNNVVYRNEWTGIFLESVRGTRTSINHNVIMENGYSGIFGAGRTEVLVRNNILTGNKQYGIFLGPDARKTRIIGNNIYANRLPFNDNADNQTIRQQNISADPQFVGAGYPRHNYTVKSGSPTKGRGEEGADIGLNESMTVAVAPSSGGGLGGAASSSSSSEFDQFFGPSSSSSSPSQDTYAPPPPPASNAPMSINTTLVLTENEVNFGYMSADLTPSSYFVLDEIVRSLAYYTNVRVEIAGHTDNQGDENFNRTLSLNRARAVLNYFVSKGIDRGRLVARGYGMERPIASNETYDGQATNRRVEVVPIR